MNDERKSGRSGLWILGLSFVMGMIGFGWLIGAAAKGYKRLDEFVTVKGLSEREVPANLVIWPVSFNLSDENLGKLQERLRLSRDIVRQFLRESGFEDAEISNAPPNIREVRFQPTKEDPVVRPPRYDASIAVLLRTTKVPLVNRHWRTATN